MVSEDTLLAAQDSQVDSIDSACPIYVDFLCEPEGDYSFFDERAKEEIINLQTVTDYPETTSGFGMAKRLLIPSSVSLEAIKVLMSYTAVEVGAMVDYSELPGDPDDRELGYRNMEVEVGTIEGQFRVEGSQMNHIVPMVLSLEFAEPIGLGLRDELSTRLWRSEYMEEIIYSDTKTVGDGESLESTFMFVLMSREISGVELNDLRNNLVHHGEVYRNSVRRADFVCSPGWSQNTRTTRYG